MKKGCLSRAAPLSIFFSLSHCCFWFAVANKREDEEVVALIKERPSFDYQADTVNIICNEITVF